MTKVTWRAAFALMIGILSATTVTTLVAVQPAAAVMCPGKNIVLSTLSNPLIDPNVNWRGCNLTGDTLAFATLDRASLNNANLTRANLFGANLTYADFTNATLTDAAVSETAFSGATFANIQSGGLGTGYGPPQSLPTTLVEFGCRLLHRSQRESRRRQPQRGESQRSGLSGGLPATLNAADLHAASLIGANLSNVYLFNSDLNAADLADATLTGTNMAQDSLNNVLSGGITDNDVSPSLPNNWQLLEPQGYLIGPNDDLAYASLGEPPGQGLNLYNADLQGSAMRI